DGTPRRMEWPHYPSRRLIEKSGKRATREKSHSSIAGGPMSNDPGFAELIDRVRKGDELAAAELVRLYEPEIKRSIRFRLTDPHLRRLLDPSDIVQSVLRSFFARAAGGQYELESEENLKRLLVTMARNKLVDHARRQKAARDGNGHPAEDIAHHEIEDPA